MKKFSFIATIIMAIASYCFFSCRQKAIPPEKDIADTLLLQTDSFKMLCNKLQILAESKDTNAGALQNVFLQARLAYKKMEWAAEYFVSATSRFVNGPPVEEIEISGQVLPPAGLQVIEGLLFPHFDTANKTEILHQLKMLQSKCDKYTTYFRNIDLFDWQVFDAIKLEVFRIETLGITGFDNPLTLKSMAESAASLESLQKVIAHYAGGNTNDFQKKFSEATACLTAHPDFNSFNRAAFIMEYVNPLTSGITALESNLHIHIIRYNRLLNQEAATLFDRHAFNVNAYAPDQSSFMTDKKTALGKLLFADPILSGTGKRSCQSCHQPDKAFTDGLAENTVIDGNTFLQRNTPTLINAALQPSQFYDLRVNTLEDQSLNVVQNILEMHGSMRLSVEKLWKDTAYRRMFSSAFPKKNRSGIDTLEVMNAISSYIRSLVFLNSRFDAYMRRNKAALSADEISGFNIFMGKARCATCHYMPLFNGTFPPRYMKIESEVIGVPQSLANKEIDSDMGRYNIIKAESFKHAFKIPTLRNAALTAPYMHNGIYKTLEEVVDFYNKGGGIGLGLPVKNQTLPFDSLRLTQQESKDLVAFIKSLTDER